MPSINVELANYSDLFMLISAFVYLVAFLVFALDMARSSQTIRRLEADLAREETAQQLQTDQRMRDKTRSARHEAQLTAAGARTGVGTVTGTTVAGGRTPADGEPTGTGSAAVGSEKSTAVPGPEITAQLREELVDEDMDYTGAARRPLANVAVAMLAVGAALHAFAVIARGVAGHRVPWGNMYEFLTTGALLVAVVYLLFLIRKDLRFVGTFVSGLVVVMMCAATMGFPTPLAHLQPALQSPWLIIHVSVAVLASALFTLTFAMSVLQLIQKRQEVARAEGRDTRWAFLRLVPSALSLENWSYRINAVAFVMWTFTLIAGAIWAEAAWGRYWNWDTKEVWTFVIWVVYAGYLHARATRGWTGTRAAWLSIIGFACVVFNFTIVNTYFPGLHSYAGLPE